jgi:hypothetical protein
VAANIGDTCCKVCRGEVELEEAQRPVSRSDMGPSDFAEYNRKGLWVARARCSRCGTLYLAWIDVSAYRGCHLSNADRSRKLVDLSFRSSFRDEPTSRDLPSVEVLREVADEQRRRDVSAVDREIADLERQIRDLRGKAVMIEADMGGRSRWERYLDDEQNDDDWPEASGSDD